MKNVTLTTDWILNKMVHTMSTTGTVITLCCDEHGFPFVELALEGTPKEYGEYDETTNDGTVLFTSYYEVELEDLKPLVSAERFTYLKDLVDSNIAFQAARK